MSTEGLLSFRGFYIFTESGRIAYSQKYSTVESRVPKKSKKIPTNQELSSFFQKKVLESITSETHFNYKIDNDLIICVLPIKFFFLCVIPLIQNESSVESAIAGSMYFLSYIESVLRSTIRSLMPDSPLIEFYPLKQILNLVMPFGSPIIHDQYLVSQLTSRIDISRFNAGYKEVEPRSVPSWKEALLFPCQQLEITIKEAVFGSISKTEKLFKIFGELRSTASISYLPEITLPFTLPQTMSNVQAHFSVKSFKDGKLVFVPPTGVSQLLTWEVPTDAENMPITGTYGYKIDGKTINYDVKIKINNNITQSTLHLPFPNLGTLVQHNFETMIGQVKQGRSETTISWDINSSVNEEIEIRGSLTFEDDVKEQDFKAVLSFKSYSRTFTGNCVKKEDVVIVPNAKVAISTTLSFSTEKKYVIWATPL